MNIPAFTVPHGVFEWDITNLPDQRFSSETVRHLVAFEPSLSEIESGFVASTEALISHEYGHTVGVLKTNLAVDNNGDPLPSIVVLVDHATVLTSGVLDVGMQVSGLLELARRHPQTQLLLKDHPSHPIFQRFLPNNLPSNFLLASQDEDLHLLLERCSGVLLWNYLGSALVHAMLSGKPVARVRTGRGRNSDPEPAAPKAWVDLLSHAPTLTSMEFVAQWMGAVSRQQMDPPRQFEVRSCVATSGVPLHTYLSRTR
jgi:hypothetical protein